MALPFRDDLPTRRVSWLTMVLIGINLAVFLLVQPSSFQAPIRADQDGRITAGDAAEVARAEEFTLRWSAVPCEVVTGEALADRPDGCDAAPSGFVPADKHPYLALLTAMFLHGSVLHLASNLLFLWVFGNNVEDRLGRFWYLVVYLVGGVLGSLTYVALHAESSVPLLGASGAIAAVMGAYLVVYPRARILSALATAGVQVVYVPAVVVLGLYFVTQFVTSAEEVAWEAHAGGMAAGALLALLIALLPSVRRRARTDVDVSLRRPAPSSF